MAADLILRKTGRENPAHEWVLQLRYHDSLGPTQYADVRHMTADMAREVLKAGAPFCLFEDQTP